MSDSSGRQVGGDGKAHHTGQSEGSSSRLNSVEILQEPKPQVYIGDATMDKDGTINLTMRRTADGMHVSGVLHYKRGTKDYDEVFCHIGGIKPGETKLVKPFDEEDNSCKNKK